MTPHRHLHMGLEAAIVFRLFGGREGNQNRTGLPIHFPVLVFQTGCWLAGILCVSMQISMNLGQPRLQSEKWVKSKTNPPTPASAIQSGEWLAAGNWLLQTTGSLLTGAAPSRCPGFHSCESRSPEKRNVNTF